MTDQSPDVETVSLRIERRLTLPPDRCFALWADPGELGRWWGPSDGAGAPFTADILAWTAAPGASWRIRMTAPDGAVFWQGGEMIEVVPPRLLRFSFHWIEEGRRGPAAEITVRFEPDGSGTRLVFIQAGFADIAVRDGHEQGWGECLDRFAAAAGRWEGRGA